MRRRKKKLSVMKSGILMMMCCRRLSPLPHTDDVLGVVLTCLPVATLSLCLACALSLEWITELCSEENQNIKQSCEACAPCRACVGSGGKPFHIHKTNRGFAVVPPVDRNLRSRNALRAWSWLSSKQISVRSRQVCSACPHSCSCF